jgi:hypothetical protein
MKIIWIMPVAVLLAMCCTMQGTEYSYITKDGGILAVGKMVGLRLEEPKHMWAAEVINVSVLLRNLGAVETARSKAFNSIPDKMKIYFYSGAVGLTTTPNSDWVGKTVIFTCTYLSDQDIFIVPDFPRIGITPDGENLHVFSSEEAPLIKRIEHVLNIVKLTDPVHRLQRLIDMVNNSEQPLFIRWFCMVRVAEAGGESSSFDPNIRDLLIGWRDNSQIVDLQMAADWCLRTHSWFEYEWSEDRFAFFRKMTDKIQIPENIKLNLKAFEKKALENKSKFEENKRKQVKSDK